MQIPYFDIDSLKVKASLTRVEHVTWQHMWWPDNKVNNHMCNKGDHTWHNGDAYTHTHTLAHTHATTHTYTRTRRMHTHNTFIFRSSSIWPLIGRTVWGSFWNTPARSLIQNVSWYVAGLLVLAVPLHVVQSQAGGSTVNISYTFS